MERMSDAAYIEKILKGETNCFARLLERYSNQVFSLIVKIVGNREDAEELTQDAFVKAFQSLAQFRGESSFSTWIYRIAYNLAISATRKKVLEVTPIDESMLQDIPDEPDDSFLNDKRIDCLNKALEQLPRNERAIILLFYKDNKSVEEISSITGLTASNVKTKLCRIRKKLYVLINKLEM